jgi:hypothetical protein
MAGPLSGLALCRMAVIVPVIGSHGYFYATPAEARIFEIVLQERFKLSNSQEKIS